MNYKALFVSIVCGIIGLVIVFSSLPNKSVMIKATKYNLTGKTSSGEYTKLGIVALSRDLEKNIGYKFGDTVTIQFITDVIDRNGQKMYSANEVLKLKFQDRMHKKWTKKIDIWNSSLENCKDFGTQEVKLILPKH